MHKQVVHSLVYVLLGIAGMGILWYLDSIRSSLALPFFIVYAALGVVFNPFMGNIEYLSNLKDSEKDSEKNEDKH